MDWIHWIGKSYYTINSFKQEADIVGVSRRVDLRIMAKMNWGDKIYCAMLDGKTGVIFGSFRIDKIGGLSGEASKAIRENFRFEVINNEVITITRRCGNYNAVATCAVKTTIPEMVIKLQESKALGIQIGKPMLCGIFTPCEKIRLMNIPFRQGFRTINAEALLNAAQNHRNRAYGQFYVSSKFIEENEPHTIRAEGQIQAVENYQKKKAGERKASHAKALPGKALAPRN